MDKLFNTGILKKDSTSVFLVSIIVIAVIIAYWRVLIQSELGPIWDTFDFLSNAMYFAGQGFGYVDYTRPPFFIYYFFSFRLGFISELTIYAVDAVFFVFGVVGLYLFFKLRFSSFQSFCLFNICYFPNRCILY